jgi:hypothetical protein
LEYADPGRIVRYLLEHGDEVSSKLSSTRDGSSHGRFGDDLKTDLKRLE